MIFFFSLPNDSGRTSSMIYQSVSYIYIIYMIKILIDNRNILLKIYLRYYKNIFIFNFFINLLTIILIFCNIVKKLNRKVQDKKYLNTNPPR